MASARELEKFFTKSPYLPSFEYFTKSRHSGLAMAKISSSVFSVMLGLATASMLLLVHQVVARRLLHGVVTGLRIPARNREHVPVRVVHLHGVAPVVVARPAGLLAEQRVLRDTLGG